MAVGQNDDTHSLNSSMPRNGIHSLRYTAAPSVAPSIGIWYFCMTFKVWDESKYYEEQTALWSYYAHTWMFVFSGILKLGHTNTVEPLTKNSHEIFPKGPPFAYVFRRNFKKQLSKGGGSVGFFSPWIC